MIPSYESIACTLIYLSILALSTVVTLAYAGVVP